MNKKNSLSSAEQLPLFTEQLPWLILPMNPRLRDTSRRRSMREQAKAFVASAPSQSKKG